jgi:hypothetical protein
MSHYFKYKLNQSQHGFSKAKSSTTNLVPYLDIVCLPVTSQHQVYSINVDIKSVFDFASRSVLLHRLCAHGLPGSYVNWFRSYLSYL